MGKCAWCGKNFRDGEGKKSYKGKSTGGKVGTFFNPFTKEFCSSKCVSDWENSKG